MPFYFPVHGLLRGHVQTSGHASEDSVQASVSGVKLSLKKFFASQPMPILKRELFLFPSWISGQLEAAQSLQTPSSTVNS